MKKHCEIVIRSLKALILWWNFRPLTLIIMLKPCHGVRSRFSGTITRAWATKSVQEVVLPSQLIWHFKQFKPFRHNRVTPGKHSFVDLVNLAWFCRVNLHIKVMYKFRVDMNKKEINSIHLCNACYFHIFNRYSGVAQNW